MPGGKFLPGALALVTAGCTARSGRLNEDHIRSMETGVRYSTQVRPISYLKANAADVLLDLAAKREPMVITQNGEAKAVLQDVASYEETQEALALLKLLALGNRDIECGRTTPAREVIDRLRSANTEG